MPSLIDLTNRRFGRWIVLRRSGTKRYPSGARQPLYLCHCDCGTEKEVAASILRDGSSKSCGCLNADVRREMCIARNTKHGHAANGKSYTYTTWLNMISRCHNPNGSGYYKYGARGIAVCDRWRNSFENFLADMGEKPYKEASIERINPFKGYEPSNCAWIHVSDQQNRKTNSRIKNVTELRTMVRNFCEANNIDIRTFSESLCK